jgi:hypothetical protein
MCRTAGRRCSDHPKRKFMKFAEQANKYGADAEQIGLQMTALEMKSPETYQDTEEYKKLALQRKKLLAKVDETESKRDESLKDYYATPGGQEYLKNKSTEEETTTSEKIDATAEQIAGANRRINANKFGQLLNNPDVNAETRIFLAQNEIRNMQRSINAGQRRIRTLKESAIDEQKYIDEAQKMGDNESVAKHKSKLAGIVTEMSILEKQVAQNKGRKKDLQGWLTSFMNKNIGKVFDFNEIMIRQTIKNLF